jgi:hypothetical protein
MKEEIKIPSLSKPILWKFPDAPKAPVTCNQGYQMRSWFDIEDIPITVDAKDYPAGSIHCALIITKPCIAYILIMFYIRLPTCNILGISSVHFT